MRVLLYSRVYPEDVLLHAFGDVLLHRVPQARLVIVGGGSFLPHSKRWRQVCP